MGRARSPTRGAAGAAGARPNTCCVSVSHCLFSSCLSASSRSIKARWREILASNWPFAASAFASASAVHVAVRRARQLRAGTRGARLGCARAARTLCRLLRGARLLLLELKLGFQLGVLPSQILRRRQ